MRRFYRGAAMAAAVLLASAPAVAQPAERPPLGSSMTVDALGWLPAASNLFSLLDTVVPDVIADRIDTGGLSAGEPARVGAHGSTWTQTLFTLGDVDITNPIGTGTPLLVPDVTSWQRVDVATGMMPIDRDAPGLAVSLTPRGPSPDWQRGFLGVVSPPGFNANGDVGRRPSIARLNTWMHAELFAAGPLTTGKLGLFATGSATRSTHFERNSPAQIDANIAQGFVRAVGTPTADDDLSVVGWFQRSRDPVANHRAVHQPNAGEQDLALHVQSSWEHRFDRADTSVRLFGGFSNRERTNNLYVPDFVAIERLQDGPIQDVLDVGPGTDRSWSAGARLFAVRTRDASGAFAARHELVGGIEVSGASTTWQSTYLGTVGELIDGIPARIWTFNDPVEPSAWRSLGAAAFIQDTVAIHPRLTVNGGLRLDAVNGARRSEGGTPISWTNVLPRAGAHWMMTNFWQLSSFGQYGQYAHRLPLRDLAYGDPTAATGTIYRWDAPVGTTTLQPDAIGPLVQRIGPGTNGDPQFSAIAPGLNRPVMSELLLGFEARPGRNMFARLVAIGRRERNMIGVQDVGVPQSTYSTIGVPDPGVDLIHPEDDQILIFYDRSPSTFGADRYLLANPAEDRTSFVGADVSFRVQTPDAFLLAGMTAGRSEALSANRGFGPLENDAGILGEVYINPNAEGHAQGRVFTERGYTIKVAGGRQLWHGFEFSMIARYQDGQHFARLVIMEDLNQGPEAVRAFRNGRTRFTFTMTVDGRLQRTFAIGSHRATAYLDAYNMFNQALEVEEFQVSGAMSRLTTAVQPPRVVQVGIRLPF